MIFNRFLIAWFFVFNPFLHGHADTIRQKYISFISNDLPETATIAKTEEILQIPDHKYHIDIVSDIMADQPFNAFKTEDILSLILAISDGYKLLITIEAEKSISRLIFVKKLYNMLKDQLATADEMLILSMLILEKSFDIHDVAVQNSVLPIKEDSILKNIIHITDIPEKKDDSLEMTNIDEEKRKLKDAVENKWNGLWNGVTTIKDIMYNYLLNNFAKKNIIYLELNEYINNCVFVLNDKNSILWVPRVLHSSIIKSQDGTTFVMSSDAELSKAYMLELSAKKAHCKTVIQELECEVEIVEVDIDKNMMSNICINMQYLRSLAYIEKQHDYCEHIRIWINILFNKYQDLQTPESQKFNTINGFYMEWFCTKIDGISSIKNTCFINTFIEAQKNNNDIKNKKRQQNLNDAQHTLRIIYYFMSDGFTNTLYTNPIYLQTIFCILNVFNPLITGLKNFIILFDLFDSVIQGKVNNYFSLDFENNIADCIEISHTIVEDKYGMLKETIKMFNSMIKYENVNTQLQSASEEKQQYRKIYLESDGYKIIQE